MNQNTIQLLFALLRSAIHGNQLSDNEKNMLSDDVINELCAVSKKHDVAHLLALGLEKNGLLSNENSKIKNEKMLAIYRYTQLNHEYEKLCNALETSGTAFIPLKGSVLRKWYPEPWMRTSCDIDILVHADEAEKTATYLTSNCGYSRDGKGSHDISLFSPGKMHIELHYDLVEDGLANESSEVLKTVWETAVAHDDYRHWLDMTDEMFYFYHIAHMAKHFVNGGCGIRPFIDLWILDNVRGKNEDKRDVLLKRGNLFQFAQVARSVSRVWMSNAERSEITEQVEQYILRGGVYGTGDNRIAVQQQKKGGKWKYVFSRIFLRYDAIKFHYPVLQKHRWLTPIMEVRRWLKLFRNGRANRSIKELQYNNNITQAEAKAVQTFLENIGL